MSEDLRLWQPAAGQPLPTSLEAVGHAVLALEHQQPGPNPTFQALAQRLDAAVPSLGGSTELAAWAADLADQARSGCGAVWAMPLPPDELPRVLRVLVDEATTLGLAVLADGLGMAFLPGGQVLPPEQAAQWADLKRQIDQAPAPVGKADLTQAMATFLRQVLEPQGFRPVKAKHYAVRFSRPTAQGAQAIEMELRGRAPDFDCVVMCCHSDDRVQQLFHGAFGQWATMDETLFFNLTSFVGQRTGGQAIPTRQAMRAVVDLLVQRALPVLDLAAQSGGLDRVYNEPALFPVDDPNPHPVRPRTLAASMRAMGDKHCLKPIITAWLAGNPGLDAVVAELRAFAQGRADVTGADIDHLLAHLAAQQR
jgi:hypothetical protein